MGNCINVMACQSQEKVRVITLSGAQREFKASTPIKRITSGRFHGYKLVHHTEPFSPLPQDTKLEPGEVYYLFPDVPKPPCKASVSLENAKEEFRKTGRVKIVITKQQLEFLLRNAKRFRSGKLAFQFSDSFSAEDNRKWHPSLAPIPEVHNFEG